MRCKECESLFLGETKDENHYKKYREHPYKLLLGSYSHWDETVQSFYCKECEEVFGVYINNPPLEGEVTEYSFYHLPSNLSEIDNCYYDVGEYLYYQELIESMKKTSENNDLIEVYSMAHVDDFTAWKNGEKKSLSECRKHVYENFGELLNRFWGGRWVINQRYYYKIKIPKNSLIPEWKTATVEPMGSGYGGFDISSDYIASCEEIEVLDPLKNIFVPLTDWEIPPVYEQRDKIIDKYFEQYKIWEEKTKNEYEESVKKIEEKVKSILKEKFNYIETA